MKSAQDYLAERLQQTEASLETREFAAIFWENVAVKLMTKAALSKEQCQAIYKKFLRQEAITDIDQL